MRHAFTGTRVDMQVVQDQAHGRMYDKHPESTVIHWHPANVPCNSWVAHRLYDHEEGVIARWLEGQEMPEKFRSQPMENKPAISDGD